MPIKDLKISQVYDNKPVIVRQGKKLILGCCDCGLVHTVKIKKRTVGGFRLYFVRDIDRTSVMRRKVGIAIKEINGATQITKPCIPKYLLEA